MSGNAMELLRLLEPAVRPAGLPAPSQARAKLPLEQQDFQTLLANVQQRDSAVGTTAEAPAVAEPAQTAGVNSTRLLAGFDLIDNASLRQLVAQRGKEAEQLPPTNQPHLVNSNTIDTEF